MRKSTLFMVIAIAGAIATMASADLKLKKEYGEGHFLNPYVKQSLPAFHYIREELDTTAALDLRFEILVSDTAQPGVSLFYKTPPKLLYKVSNDTLVIASDPLERSLWHTSNPIRIHTPGLKALNVSNGEYLVKYNDSSSLVATLGGLSNVKFNFTGVRSLDITASGSANVEISSKKDIQDASIRLSDKSSLQINDFLIAKKTMVIGDSVSLKLNGRAIADFGIARNTVQK